MRFGVLAIALLGAAGCRQLLGFEGPLPDDQTVMDGRPPGDGMVDVAVDAPPSCTDDELSPDETDVDCGGPACPPCSVGDTCGGHDDCQSSLCASGVCVNAVSCVGVRDAGQLTSGVYPIDPDGTAGGIVPFDAYCDQSTAGGGWTLIMKLSSTGTALVYSAPYWTTTATLSEADLQPNTAPAGTDAKLVAFNHVVGTELRLEWREPIHAFLYTAGSPRTALTLFTGPEVMVFGNENDACHGTLLSASPSFLASDMRHSRGPQFYGINGQDSESGASPSAMRFGFGSNDEPANTWDPHHAAGAHDASLRWGGQTDCNNCQCYGTDRPRTVTSANLWIR